jgi:hypothetical protein
MLRAVRAARLRTVDKLLVVFLGSHGDAEDCQHGARPGLRRLASEVGATQHTVLAAIQRLESAGVLNRTVRPGVGTDYELHFDALPLEMEQRCSDCSTANGTALCEVQRSAANGTAPVLQSEQRTVPLTEPLTVPTRARALPGDFETFWRVYPRKVGKRAALAAWKGLNGSRPPLEVLVASVKAHAESEQWTSEGGRYIPHPATFLRQGRWEDELDATPCGNSTRPAPSPDDLEALRRAREDDDEVMR